jgi:cytoskeletal protein RodZ
VAVTRDPDDRGGDAPAEPAWHERTSILVGASAAALVVLVVLYFIISTLVRSFNDPDPAPQYYLDPGGTSSFSRTQSAGATTTTETVTSTSPPVTSDINPGDPTSTTSTTSGTDTTTTSTESAPRIPPHTRDSNEPTTTRSRPRLNETRTLYPQP